jgi:hypothetical protein
MDKVKKDEKIIEGSVNKPNVSVIEQQRYRPPSFPDEKRISESIKVKLYERIVDATGDQKKELNVLPRGLLMQMVALDIFAWLNKCMRERKQINEEDIVNQIVHCIDVRLRSVGGVLLNKVTSLAETDLRASNPMDQYGTGVPDGRY